jgi:hypothetical protein
VTNSVSSLRIRIANALYQDGQRPMSTAANLADAVIEALDLGAPCAANGCRLRQIAQKASAENSATACFSSAEIPNGICDCADCCG